MNNMLKAPNHALFFFYKINAKTMLATARAKMTGNHPMSGLYLFYAASVEIRVRNAPVLINAINKIEIEK
jgi:hypothetical protein